MKNITFFILASVVLFCFTSCKKAEEAAPANNDTNYDLHNRIFRVKVSSTAPYTLTLSDYTTGSTPVNVIDANQTGPFDYGFTPTIGHTIKVTVRSSAGKITSSVLYNGVYLDPPIQVKDATGGGSTADYTFEVKN